MLPGGEPGRAFLQAKQGSACGDGPQEEGSPMRRGWGEKSHPQVENEMRGACKMVA